ncbi:MAG: hypothetical protein ACE5HG_03360 [Candidatus Bathyarchaeia archaeon]
MGQVIPKGSVVYIRYKDHVLFRNTTKPVKDVAEREPMGWLTHENKEHVCAEHDRTIENLQCTSGTGSGMVRLKSCILEIRALPLQKFQRGSLSCQNDITRNAEYALQNAKRKTQPE